MKKRINHAENLRNPPKKQANPGITKKFAACIKKAAIKSAALKEKAKDHTSGR
jgi:hypothetical protein